MNAVWCSVVFVGELSLLPYVAFYIQYVVYFVVYCHNHWSSVNDDCLSSVAVTFTLVTFTFPTLSQPTTFPLVIYDIRNVGWFRMILDIRIPSKSN